jgi:septum site-determining protein MinC
MHAMAEPDDVEVLFATETMAELCARQGRVADAAAIFGRLLQKDPNAVAAARWAERLAELKATGIASASPAQTRAQPMPESISFVEPSVRKMPLVIRQTVRSGQIAYARGTDLIVLASVNVGAQLLADGNIHVYGVLRGRAVAGATGEKEARIYCQRLEAELVGIGGAYLMADDFPRDQWGKPAQVGLETDRCVVMPLFESSRDSSTC